MKNIETVIYCLKNPADRNRIFYVGKTIRPLGVRLSGHLSHPSNSKMATLLESIKKAGKRPIIEELEKCLGPGTAYRVERRWIKYYNKRSYKLLQYGYDRK